MVKENGSRWVLYEFLYQHWYEKELQSYLLLCVKYEMVPDNILYTNYCCIDHYLYKFFCDSFFFGDVYYTS